MRHASTIAMARTLLAQGRPDDVSRMIDPLATDDVRDASDAMMHALTARVHLLVHADPQRAEAHLDQAFSLSSPASQSFSAERLLWRGWLRAWPHRETFRPAHALVDLQAAHAAAPPHDNGTRCWAFLGAAALYLVLGHPHVAQHLIDRARETGAAKHDREAEAWLNGLDAGAALTLGNLERGRLSIDGCAKSVDNIDAILYHGRVLALKTRAEVAMGADPADVDRLSDEALRSIRDGARSTCPAVAEVFFCRVDARLCAGEFDQASQLLAGAPPEIGTIAGSGERLRIRRDALASLSPPPPQPAPQVNRFPQWPDEGSFPLPFWGSLPPFARESLPILLTGERGTGKKYLAHQIHEATRAGEPFVVLDCSSPSPGDFDFLLFGTTGDGGVAAEAGGGTLLLREIDRMPLDSQRGLARHLRNGSKMSLIATSAATPAELSARSRFSTDLFDQIARLVITLPPLRQRRSHIPLLVRDFLERLRPADLPLASMTDGAMQAIVEHDWPGNIRQLQNELERMLTLVASEPAPVIHVRDLPFEPTDRRAYGIGGDGAPESLDDVLARTERQIIERVLARHDGQVTASANELGLSRQGLYKKMKRLGVEPSRFQDDERDLTATR